MFAYSKCETLCDVFSPCISCFYCRKSNNIFGWVSEVMDLIHSQTINSSTLKLLSILLFCSCIQENTPQCVIIQLSHSRLRTRSCSAQLNIGNSFAYSVTFHRLMHFFYHMQISSKSNSNITIWSIWNLSLIFISYLKM